MHYFASLLTYQREFLYSYSHCFSLGVRRTRVQDKIRWLSIIDNLLKGSITPGAFQPAWTPPSCVATRRVPPPARDLRRLTSRPLTRPEAPPSSAPQVSRPVTLPPPNTSTLPHFFPFERSPFSLYFIFSWEHFSACVDCFVFRNIFVLLFLPFSFIFPWLISGNSCSVLHAA